MKKYSEEEVVYLASHIFTHE